MSNTFARINNAAHTAALGNNRLPMPSNAQLDAGNYAKGHVRINGLDVAIENPAYTYRKSTDKTGQQWSCLMQAHYGYINGYKGNDGDNIDAFVGSIPENDTAYIINQKTQGGFFDEHKVMLGFLSQQQAVDTYQHCFERGWTGLMSVVPCTMSQLKWWLANGDKSRPVTRERLPYAGLERLDSVVWGGTDDANLYSHGGQLSKLLYQIRLDDTNNQALEPLAYHDMIAELGNQGFMYENYDALIVEYNKLERKAKQLLMVMQGAADTVKPVSVTVSKPLTKNGVSNVIAWFEMDDGQAVGVFFHNPDKNPKKLDPTDEMISYKWVLNKKDITIAVAPENGKDVIIRTVAKRIMRLVEKNHDRFAKANSDKAALNQAEQDLTAQVAEKQATLKGLQDEVAALQVRKAEKEAAQLAQEQAAIQTPPLGFVGVWDSKSGQYPFQSITGSKIASFATREDAESDFKASTIQQPSSIDYSKYPVITTDDRYGEIIEVPTIWGDKVRVAKKQLENVNRTLLKRFTKAGKEVDGDSIHRENLLVGDAKLTEIAQIEKELKEKGYKVAPFPKSKQQEKKLIDEGYVGYSLDGNGWIKPSFALAVIYAIPPISQPEPVTLTGKELENPTPPQERPSNWRTNLANARAVAKSLGIETKGKKLAQLVNDIEKATPPDWVSKVTVADLEKYMKDVLGREWSFNDTRTRKEDLESVTPMPPSYVPVVGDTVNFIDYKDDVSDTGVVQKIEFDNTRPFLSYRLTILTPSGVSKKIPFDFYRVVKSEKDSVPVVEPSEQPEPKQPEPAPVVPVPTPAAKSTDLTEEEYAALKKAYDEFKAKTDKIGAAKSREDALKIATDLVTEMPEKEDQIRRAFSDAIRDNGWGRFEINFPKQPVKVNTDMELNRTLKRLQKALEDTDYSIYGVFKNKFAKLEFAYGKGITGKMHTASIEKRDDGFYNYDRTISNYRDEEYLKPLMDATVDWLNGKTIPKMMMGEDLRWYASGSTLSNSIDAAFKEAKAKAAPAAPVTQPNNTLQKDISKSELFKDANVWAIDDFGKENGMVIYSRDEQDGFSIGIVDKLKQVNMQYTDIDTDQQTNESFSTENITNEQVIEKIKMFIAKHEQKSVELLPVQPASKSPMTNPDRDYLQSIIDGKVDPLTVDMDAVIALAEKYDGDAEITPLLDQALEAINQAEQEAAKGI